MITPLPLWVLTNKYPAIYDGESASAIEMVAKVYGKMQEMITDYNSYVKQINAAIADFEAATNQNFEDFKQEILNITSDYIACLDMKIKNQDSKIEEAIQYMKDNIIQTAETIFTEAIQNGDIQADLITEYNAENESMNISFDATGTIYHINEALEEILGGEE